MASNIESLKSGHGIQIVSPVEDHKFTLDEDALSELLLREDVRDRAVVVISVAGAFRKGKSFLLDFFLRYMHHRYNIDTGNDWLGDPGQELEGFTWRGGSERETTGLLLWSQPFKATLPSGEKVVILFMDTQGTFDSESTVRDNATVFALSTMLSSVQIFNISQNIEEDELQHLQLFTDYGRLAQQNSSGKPFQRLQFLVRDWSFPYEYEYGYRGGQKLLKKRLEVHDGQHEELQSLRRYIAGCFEQLDCFLMPHPGLKVATNPDFKGKLEDINPEFKSNLQSYVKELLDPEYLVPKKIEGETIKAKDLLQYFKVYLNIFNGKDLPEPKTILEATSEANNLSALAEAREVYERLMEEVCGGARPHVAAARLAAEHARARDKAVHAFDARRKMGGEALADTYRERLLQELEEQFKTLQAHNEGKNVFNLCSTPLVYLALAAAALLLGQAAALLGAPLVSSVAESAAMAAMGALLLWAYSRISGNLASFALQIDDVATQIRDLVCARVVKTVAEQAVLGAGIAAQHQKTS